MPSWITTTFLRGYVLYIKKLCNVLKSKSALPEVTKIAFKSKIGTVLLNNGHDIGKYSSLRGTLGLITVATESK